MSLCELLGRPYFEIVQWPGREILRWRVWALVQKRERRKREREAKSKFRK